MSVSSGEKSLCRFVLSLFFFFVTVTLLLVTVLLYGVMSLRSRNTSLDSRFFFFFSLSAKFGVKNSLTAVIPEQ